MPTTALKKITSYLSAPIEPYLQNSVTPMTTSNKHYEHLSYLELSLGDYKKQ